MTRRFVYFYFMKEKPEVIREIAPSHTDYWRTRHLGLYLGGPFADRTGGLISFESTTLARAMQLVEDDPFVVHDLLEMKWVREWEPE